MLGGNCLTEPLFLLFPQGILLSRLQTPSINIQTQCTWLAEVDFVFPGIPTTSETSGLSLYSRKESKYRKYITYSIEILTFSFSRGVNNAILDTYQLKSLDGLVEFDASRMKLHRRNGKLYVSVDWGNQYNDTSIYPRVKPDSEDNFDNFPFRLPYDHVLSCLGFVFDDSPFHEYVSIGYLHVAVFPPP